MVSLDLNNGLNAGAPVQTVDLTPAQFLQMLKMCSPLSPQYPVLLKIATSLGLQTGLNIPNFTPDGLGGYYDNNGNYYDQAGLNGFFSSIGDFVSRNVSSIAKDAGRVIGQVVKIAAPIVSGVTGIPVDKIAGFTGAIGNMIGGDLGNMMSAVSNGGESVQAQTERFAREDGWAQAEYDKAQAAANATAQSQYDAQQKAQIAAAAAIKARTPIGYVQNKPIVPFVSTNMSPTNAQIETIAAVKNLPTESVAEQVAKQLADIKAKETPAKTTIFTPTNIAIGVVGLAVVGTGIYLVAKK
jgi:hypothetical protein